MPDLDHQRVRETMISLFGKERYGDFVAAVNGRCEAKHRLFFWQEQMWAETQNSLGLRVQEFKSIAGMFRVCHVHGLELAQDRVNALGGTFKFPGTFITAQEELFPFARDVVYLSCWDGKEQLANVLFCSACRETKKAWVSENDI